MRYLPEHFRHIDWATYGLVWLHRLSEDPSLSFEQIVDVFSMTSAYRIVPACCVDCDRPIQDFLTTSTASLRSKWHFHKQVAAGIRYAYLKDLEVLSISFNDAQPPAGIARRSSYQLSDGSQYYLELLPQDELPFSAPWILQGGDPSQWYDVSRWALHRPMTPSVSVSSNYPLSSPGVFGAQYRKVLSQLGATLADTSRWFPPPATSNHDMRDYLLRHPRLLAITNDSPLSAT